MAFQDLTEQQPFWNGKDIEDGATITGKVVLFKPKRNEKSSPVMVLEQEDGKRVNVWMKSVIQSAVEGIVKEGETVRITYLGMKKTEDGKTDFHNYKVEVDR